MVDLTRTRRTTSTTLLTTLLCLTTSARAFVSMPFNSTSYFGPDGPWQAVPFTLKYYTKGSTDMAVNLYPSLLYNTYAALYIPTLQACVGDTSGACASGGALANPGPSNGSSTWYTEKSDASGYYINLNGSTWYSETQFPNDITYTNLLVDVLRVADITYPSGNTLPVEVGYFGLGADSSVSAETNIPAGLYNPGTTQSNAFGLHVGSAKFKYPGSLIFGGYDRGRVIGPVISYDTNAALNLLDITIGVEEGDSPFSFDSKQDLLKAADTSGTVSAFPRPQYPYISLDQATIEAVAENLPVNFDSSSGYWLWDTSDPMYEKVVGGAAYLGFTFPSLTGNSANETIKVPFALLNLTLESSVTGLDHDVPYFPLMKAPSSLPTFLGRAFLQSAFYGVNWDRNTSWLAQAPGPGAGLQGLGYDPVDLDDRTTNLDVPAGDSIFRQSWTNHWTALSTSNGTGGGSGGDGSGGDDDNSGGGGLSGGAIAGIVIAVVAGLAIVAAIIWFVMRRRKRKAAAWSQDSSPAAPPAYQDDKPGPAATYAHYGNAQQPINELESTGPTELDTPAQDGAYKYSPQPTTWHEVDGSGVRAELPASHK